MGNGSIHGLHSTTKYVQGSVWKWVRKEYAENQAGVQSSERPVLIISNNTFNAHSASVNCVSITSVLKESPAHIPIYITMDSHIQCEQIHTVSKTELTEYKGMAPPAVVSNVKAKIRLQFDMNEDRNTELLQGIKKSIDGLLAKPNAKVPAAENTALLTAIKDSLHDLNRKANKGFGIPEIENDIIRILTNIQANYETIKSDVNEIKSCVGKNNAEAGEAPVTAGSKRGRAKQRKYTEEDKKFIMDKSNPIDVVAKKYGYTKQYAHKMRHYFRTRLNDDEKEAKTTGTAENSKEKSKNVKPARYNEEDVLFITDKKNSIDTIIEKYGFADKMAVYRTRGYLKRAYMKPKE